MPALLPPRRAALAVALATLGLSPAVQAQLASPCDTCEACTAALSAPDARVALASDLTSGGSGPCVVVRGAGAQLDGRGRTVSPGRQGVGVRVEAPRAQVRNVVVRGGRSGFLVVGAEDVTLFHDVAEGASVGFEVSASRNPRVVRCAARGGQTGIAFGAPAAGRCPEGASLRSPGAVVRRSRVEGAEVGLSACEALPVLVGNTFERNGVGLLLGAPARGAGSGEAERAPFDACVCAPGLEGVRRGTTLLFSSGCGGCRVHEGWLPSLRAAGSDVLARATGPGEAEASRRFDAFADRCAPELTDILGIPGCVPDYACLASGAVSKVRADQDRMEVEAQLSSEGDVARFASACAEAAARDFHAGRACVSRHLSGNTVCHSRTVDVRAAPGAARFGGGDNACGTVEGWRDSDREGCTRPCDGERAVATSRVVSASEPPRPAVSLAPREPVVPVPDASSVPPTTARPAPGRVSVRGEPSGRGTLIALALFLGALATAGVVRARRRRPQPPDNPQGSS